MNLYPGVRFASRLASAGSRPRVFRVLAVDGLKVTCVDEDGQQRVIAIHEFAQQMIYTLPDWDGAV